MSHSQLILNGTALAAAQLDNGDKVVYFLDSQNQINHALYSGASWATTDLISLPQNIKPRNDTPLACAVASISDSHTGISTQTVNNFYYSHIPGLDTYRA